MNNQTFISLQVRPEDLYGGPTIATPPATDRDQTNLLCQTPQIHVAIGVTGRLTRFRQSAGLRRTLQAGLCGCLLILRKPSKLAQQGFRPWLDARRRNVEACQRRETLA